MRPGRSASKSSGSRNRFVSNSAQISPSPFLALHGALSKPKARPDTTDPGLIAALSSAYLAYSHRMFAERFLLPTVEQSFGRKVFQAWGSQVANTSVIPLPPQKKVGSTIHPFIDKMMLQIKNKALVCHAKARAKLGSALTFHCEMEMTMPFRFDARTGQLKFLPDKNPKLTYMVKLPWPFDRIIGWLVRRFVMFFDAPIRTMITGIASATQNVASPTVASTDWTGIRDFKTGAARVDGAIWLADTRPAVAVAPQRARTCVAGKFSDTRPPHPATNPVDSGQAWRYSADS